MRSDLIHFDLGTPDDVKGRAFFYLNCKTASLKTLLCSLDIDSISLKEALQEEISQGRLLLPDVFEPVFIRENTIQRQVSWEEITEMAKKDYRDIIAISNEDLYSDTLIQVALEESISRYTTIFKESLYLRILKEFANQFFHKRRSYESEVIYASLFQLAGRIWQMTRARREKDEIDLEYFYKIIVDLQKGIPYLNTKQVAEIIKLGTARQWSEMADSVDVFYLTLKAHRPITSTTQFKVKNECSEWLKQEAPSLYQEYFLALLQEDYEKAGELKVEMENKALCEI